MNFDTIETRLTRISSPLGKVSNNAGNFLGSQRTRNHILAPGAQQADMAFAGNGAGRHRDLAIQMLGIGNPAHMP
ncbi:hypothetical protein D3C77_766660 [compost metagenome]